MPPMVELFLAARLSLSLASRPSIPFGRPCAGSGGAAAVVGGEFDDLNRRYEFIGQLRNEPLVAP